MTLPAGSTCSDATPVFRSYTSFSQAAAENAYSRILIGFHFRKSVEEGTEYGRQIGKRAANLYLRTDLQAAPGLYELVASHSQKCLDVPSGLSMTACRWFSGPAMEATTRHGGSSPHRAATHG